MKPIVPGALRHKGSFRNLRTCASSAHINAIRPRSCYFQKGLKNTSRLLSVRGEYTWQALNCTRLAAERSFYEVTTDLRFFVFSRVWLLLRGKPTGYCDSQDKITFEFTYNSYFFIKSLFSLPFKVTQHQRQNVKTNSKKATGFDIFIVQFSRFRHPIMIMNAKRALKRLPQKQLEFVVTI
ncbi:MAG: hypothetical protein O7D30_00740 [Rickettsia endosymbiont of Ixodes persulcatus]|nr:hypothetical protein [Rickettsia endosymbiont of Ixodes persulcatus]